MFDRTSDSNPVRVISPAAPATDNTPRVGQVVNAIRNGNPFNALTYYINVGALSAAAATFTTLLEESDTGAFSGEENEVDDIDLVGTEALASFTQADDNKCFKLGYNGQKQFTRLTITPAGNDADAYISAIAVLGAPRTAPAPNPPA